ncbi:unnamed protein product [Symbiodinium microadriaticum]|nr:unnamed protein product [Symbiodinium microadriaticum]
MSGKQKKERVEDGLKRGGGVNYAQVLEHRIDDKRHEREKEYKRKQMDGTAVQPSRQAASSTFDAFQRMAAGLEGRTLAEKIADPNRPSWEQYKKDNEDKLDMMGAEMRKMTEYRAQLDREREEKLAKGRSNSYKRNLYSDSEEDEDSDDSSSKHHKKKKHKKEKKSKKDKKKHKKSHKKRKSKKSSSRDGHSTDGVSSEEGSESGGEVDESGDDGKANHTHSS